MFRKFNVHFGRKQPYFKKSQDRRGAETAGVWSKVKLTQCDEANGRVEWEG